MPKGYPGSGKAALRKKLDANSEPLPAQNTDRIVTEVTSPPSERIRAHIDNYHEQLEGEKPKRRNNREEKAQEAELVSLKSQFSPIGRFLTQLVCLRMSNPIPPSEQELQLAEQATDALVEKYAPLLRDNGAEFSAFLVFGGILLPRAGLEKYFAKNKPEPHDVPALKPDPVRDVSPKLPDVQAMHDDAGSIL